MSLLQSGGSNDFPRILFQFIDPWNSLRSREKTPLDWKVQIDIQHTSITLQIQILLLFAWICSRSWWVIAVSLAVTMCVLGVLTIWWKWHDRPVLMSFNDKTSSVGSIPFPAVTICSTKKFTTDKVNIAKITELLNEIEINQTSLSKLSSEEWVKSPF